MVDNLAENVNECPLNRGRVEYCLCTIGTAKLSVIWSSEVSAIQGLLKYEVNGRAVGTFRTVRYRPFHMGVASRLATDIYAAMVTPILYDNSYSLNDSNLKYESYQPYG